MQDEQLILHPVLFCGLPVKLFGAAGVSYRNLERSRGGKLETLQNLPRRLDHIVDLFLICQKESIIRLEKNIQGVIYGDR